MYFRWDFYDCQLLNLRQKATENGFCQTSSMEITQWKIFAFSSFFFFFGILLMAGGSKIIRKLGEKDFHFVG